MPTDTTAPTTPTAPATGAPQAPASSGAPQAPATGTAPASPAAPAIDMEALAKMIGSVVDAKLATIAKPTAPTEPSADPLKDAPPWARELTSKIAGLEQQQLASAEANRRAALERAALAGVPEANTAKARTMLAGLLVERGVAKIPDDTTALAGDLGKALQQLAPDLYRVPGSPYGALPRSASGGGIDWSQVGTIAEVPVDEIKNIPPEHYQRIVLGNGAGAGGIPSTKPETIRLVAGVKK